MARRKHEVQLQQEIETTEEWEEVMAKEGLFVIDVYQEWCGPCAALVTNFRRLKNEIGDDLLRFAIAKADTIDALEKYRGRCEPCFLFYAGGVLVAVIHGARAPEIQRTITEQLKQEHHVQDGSTERKEIRDPVIVKLEEAEKKLKELEDKEHEKEDEPEEEPKGFTVALIKPDAVKNGKVEEIIQQMEEAGIEIVAQEERQLTEDEAREFYSHLEGEEYFEDLISFMSSGPSYALVLTKGKKGDTVLQEWRDMLGPPTVEEAKESAPESMRAKYGSDKYMNALHGSDSPETAARELAFFFPNIALPTVRKGKHHQRPQRTLALIRPDAFKNHKDEILDKIKEAGFRVALQKEMTLSKEQAEEFYKEHADKPYFDELTTRMSSGPLLALGLAREDAVKGWREMLGPAEVDVAKQEAPDSLRAMFADDLPVNPLHGSDTVETAEEELHYFFPVEQTIAVIKPDAIGTKEEIVDKIHEAGFRIAARKEQTITREIAEDFYSEHKDKDYFNDLVEHMVSGPTMFMVLSREEAVTGWRETIGPTDPEVAKLEAPDSLRAKFGESLLKNALHGSSNPEKAKYAIEQVFGQIEFNLDGTVKESESGVTTSSESAGKGVTRTASKDDGPEYKQQQEGEGEGEGEEGKEAGEEQEKEGDEQTQEPGEPGEKTEQGVDEAKEPGEEKEKEAVEEPKEPAAEPEKEAAETKESIEEPAKDEEQPAETKEPGEEKETEGETKEPEATPAEDAPTEKAETETAGETEQPSESQDESKTETQAEEKPASPATEAEPQPVAEPAAEPEPAADAQPAAEPEPAADAAPAAAEPQPEGEVKADSPEVKKEEETPEGTKESTEQKTEDAPDAAKPEETKTDETKEEDKSNTAETDETKTADGTKSPDAGDGVKT